MLLRTPRLLSVRCLTCLWKWVQPCPPLQPEHRVIPVMLSMRLLTHFIFLLVLSPPKPHSQTGDKRWNSLEAPDSVLFPWDAKSTYIRCPSFFDKLVSTVLLPRLVKAVLSPQISQGVHCLRLPLTFQTKEPVAPPPIENAHVLLYLGDAVTTDHISPAGSISRSSAAAKYLTNRGCVGARGPSSFLARVL